MSKRDPSPGEIINDISQLLPGESLVYWRGPAGWIGSPQYNRLIEWMYAPATQEQYIFVQRRVTKSEVGTFEYIARRKHG